MKKRALVCVPNNKLCVSVQDVFSLHFPSRATPSQQIVFPRQGRLGDLIIRGNMSTVDYCELSNHDSNTFTLALFTPSTLLYVDVFPMLVINN